MLLQVCGACDIRIRPERDFVRRVHTSARITHSIYMERASGGKAHTVGLGFTTSEDPCGCGRMGPLGSKDEHATCSCECPLGMGCGQVGQPLCSGTHERLSRARKVLASAGRAVTAGRRERRTGQREVAITETGGGISPPTECGERGSSGAGHFARIHSRARALPCAVDADSSWQWPGTAAAAAGPLLGVVARTIWHSRHGMRRQRRPLHEVWERHGVRVMVVCPARRLGRAARANARAAAEFFCGRGSLRPGSDSGSARPFSGSRHGNSFVCIVGRGPLRVVRSHFVHSQ